MLVLALQFSKGIAGVGTVRRRKDVTLTGHAVAAELESSCRCAEGGHGPAPSKRKRRQSRSIRIERRRSLRLSNSDRPTHQCTNWELVRTGPDECRPTIEQYSLERR